MKLIDEMYNDGNDYLEVVSEDGNVYIDVVSYGDLTSVVLTREQVSKLARKLVKFLAAAVNDDSANLRQGR